MMTNFRPKWLYVTFMAPLICRPVFLTSHSTGNMILRVRRLDGSIYRHEFPLDLKNTTTLSDVVSHVLSQNHNIQMKQDLNATDIICYEGSVSPSINAASSVADTKESLSLPLDTSRTIEDLGLRHGSILSLVSTQPNRMTSRTSDLKSVAQPPFDPYPQLSKRSRRHHPHSMSSSNSYARMAQIRSHTIHNVETQASSSIHRIYMCHRAAQRFREFCASSTASSGLGNGDEKAKTNGTWESSRCAILLGTIQMERKDLKKKKNVSRIRKTSLHSTTPAETSSSDDMCEVVKVHAVWIPPSLGAPVDSDVRSLWLGGTISADSIPSPNSEVSNYMADEYQRMWDVASSLGLRVVGWIFSYQDETDVKVDGSSATSIREESSSLPLVGYDVISGAWGQIDTMKRFMNAGKDDRVSAKISRGRLEDAGKFVTLAMEVKSGATEAFQLSDICVQMVAEGVMKFRPLMQANKKRERFLTTTRPILIDGKETNQIDTVLCLVNTAMLSHTGKYSGLEENFKPVKKSGTLTSKAKKAILKLLTSSPVDNPTDHILLEHLCDFSVLMALSKLLSDDVMTELFQLVKKFANGQKKGTVLDKRLKIQLQSILSE